MGISFWSMAARCGSGLFFNFNGTAGILRRAMIEDAGGWQHDTLTEDYDLSYRAQLKGWRFMYLPGLDCPSELPVETYGFQVQQSRWAKGLTQVALKLLPTILRSKLPFRTKLEALLHLTPNITYPMMIVVSALMLPVMIIRCYMWWFQMLMIEVGDEQSPIEPAQAVEGTAMHTRKAIVKDAAKRLPDGGSLEQECEMRS